MGENPLTTLTCGSAAELAQAVFRQKEQRRRTLAAMSVEEKYQHFLKLQRMVVETLRAAGRSCPDPWPANADPELPRD